MCILFCTCVYGRRENVYKVVYLYENISIHEYIPPYPPTLYFYSPMSRYTQLLYSRVYIMVYREGY